MRLPLPFDELGQVKLKFQRAALSKIIYRAATAIRLRFAQGRAAFRKVSKAGVPMAISLQKLQGAVASAAAMRRVRKLQPAGGPGDKIFPPTYPGEGRNPTPRHVFERRRIDRMCSAF